MNLEPVQINGKHGLVAYFDRSFAMVPKEDATLAKVVFDDGTRAFYTVTSAKQLSYRERWIALGGCGSGITGHKPGEDCDAGKKEQQEHEHLPQLEAVAHGLGDGYSVAAQHALFRLRDTLMRESFGDGQQKAQETMAAVTSDGRDIGPVVKGGQDFVNITDDAIASWKKDLHGADLIQAHTHPSNTAPSFQDLIAANTTNRDMGQFAIKKFMVFGHDGSWYEVGLPKVYAPEELQRIQEDVYDPALRDERTAALRATDQWVVDHLHMTPATNPHATEDRFKNGFRDKNGRFWTRAQVALSDPRVVAAHDRHYRDQAWKTWQVMADHGFVTFRYHLAE